MIFGVMASTIGTAITVLGSLMTSMRTLSFYLKPAQQRPAFGMALPPLLVA